MDHRDLPDYVDSSVDYKDLDVMKEKLEKLSEHFGVEIKSKPFGLSYVAFEHEGVSWEVESFGGVPLSLKKEFDTEEAVIAFLEGTPNPAERCGTCHFWRQDFAGEEYSGKDVGLCCRNSINQGWNPTHKDRWCGEWKR